MGLTNAEEQVMGYVWKLGKGYMKNILDEFPEPKPATTTVATLLKRMISKGYVGFDQHGSNRLYYPLVKKSDYFTDHLKTIISGYFDNSTAQFVSLFTSSISESELEELRDLVDRRIKSNENKK